MSHRHISRNALAALCGLIALVLATAGLAPGAAGAPAASGAAAASEPYLVGRGIADVTGQPAENGMLGYADFAQNTSGIHLRQRSRAFVIVDRATGERVVHVVADTGMIFQGIRDAVLTRLDQRLPGTYSERNVMLTATHTHAGPGGDSHHNLYNLTTLGYHGKTFEALVNGIVSSITRAHADLAPATLTLSTSQLNNASVNRARSAFDRNPAADKAVFPHAIDPQSTTLQVRRGGVLDGVINWFPVHATSMSTHNTLISPDNKGFASYRWERQVKQVDYIDQTDPAFISSFAQTNAGDMSPNLNLHPTDGPTTDEFENTRIIGTRMYDSASKGLATNVRTVTGGIDSRIVYVDMADVDVSGAYTPDGKPHSTCSAALGAAFIAGSTEDGGGGLPLHSGQAGGDALWSGIAGLLYTASPALKSCQAPKEVLLPVGSMDLVQQKLPVQLMRIGGLYLIGMPAEVTIVSGLRLRRTVARIVGAELKNVLVQGYANAYAHYLTTPEEYDSKEYEAASTLFGRYELPAFMQVTAGLATAMKAGSPVELGTKERDRSGEQISSPSGAVVLDAPPFGHGFGDVLTAPAASYPIGDQASVTFAGAHPNNNLRRGGTYLAVERKVGSNWVRVADDGDWSTKFRWAREGLAASRVTVTWDIPVGTPIGTYRIRYFGDSKNLFGSVSGFTGTSPAFVVTQ